MSHPDVMGWDIPLAVHRPYGNPMEGGVRVQPGSGLPRGLLIPTTELVERFARATGPGGQGVNTTDSRVQLSFDVAASGVLTDGQRARLLDRLATRLDGTVLTVDAAEYRSQRRNRAAARRRLADLIHVALAPPAPKRRPTRPSRGSVERRLSTKRRRAITKAGRGRPDAASGD